MKKFLALALALAMVLSLAACGSKETATTAPVAKDEYPSKTVKLVVPYGAGGSTDMGGRVVASCLANHLKGNYIVENQAGGAAVPGTKFVADANPDGYTLSYNWYASFHFRPQFMETGYSMDDFKYICGTTIQANTVFIRNDETRFHDFESLVSYMKAHPGELNYSCGAAGSWQLLIALNLLDAVGCSAVEVPYTSANDSRLALLAGDVDFVLLETATFTSELSSKPFGVNPIVCLEPNRNTLSHPDTPTIGELGYPQVADCAVNRIVIAAPKDTPDEIIKDLDNAVAEMCKDETFLMLSKKCYQVIDYQNSDYVTKELHDVYDDVGKLIVKAGLKK